MTSLAARSATFSAPQVFEYPTGESEAYRVLCGLAQGRFGAIPGELVASHIMAVTDGADWPVWRAAVEAALRRWSFAERDRLHVKSRPRVDILGRYNTQRRGSAARPYATQLFCLRPLAASCDCPDFLRSSLGLCKHVLVVLGDLARRPKRLERAIKSGRKIRRLLAWNPVRELSGEGDWLARVTWSPVGEAKPTATMLQLRRWFVFDEHGEARIADSHLTRPARRLALVSDLLRLISARGAHDLVDTALVRLLHTEDEKLKRVVEGERHSRRLKGALKGLKRKLYPYQREGVQRFLESGRLLLADDMGLGKTAQAIAACVVLWRHEQVRRGLVVVPASLKFQWLREWRLFCDVPVEVVDGAPSQRQALYKGCDRGFLIVNYEQILRDIDQIRKLAPDIVVLDEAQRIKNWATKTASYVKQMEPAYRLVLTGTPMENRLDELASIVEWVDPMALAPTWRLGPYHTATADGGHEVSGARNLDTLRTRLSRSMLRRLRADVLSQLPPRTDTTVPVELTPAQRDEHDALDQPIARLLAAARRRPLSQEEFLRLMQLLTQQRMICDGLALYEFAEVWQGIRDVRPSDSLLATLSSPKLVELRELVRNLAVEQGRKIVVFSQWRHMLELAHWAVRDVLSRAKVKALFFTGQERPKRRTQNVVDFHDDPQARILFATDAGGVGLNLQHAATCCINLDLPWNPAVLEQRIGRIYRLGQQHPIEVYNLVCENGIESRIAEIVGNKRALFVGLFDGSSDEVQFERSGTFLTRIERVVQVKADDRNEQDDSDAPDIEEEAGAQAETSEPTEEQAVTDAPNQVVAVPLQAAAYAVSAADSVQTVGGEAAVTESSRRVAGAMQVQGVDPVSVAEALDLFRGLDIRPGADGGVTIQAPPEAARLLAALLQRAATQLLGASLVQTRNFAHPESPGDAGLRG